jgi:hypothetical protein
VNSKSWNSWNSAYRRSWKARSVIRCLKLWREVGDGGKRGESCVLGVDCADVVVVFPC